MTVAQVLSGLATIKCHSEKQLSDICHECCEFWGCVQLTRWLQHCPPDLLPVNWMLHFPIVSLLQRCLRIWQYFQPPSRPHTTYNHASLGLYHIQLHHLQGCVRQATWTAESIFLLAFFPSCLQIAYNIPGLLQFCSKTIAHTFMQFF